jgi:ubiquinone/menaquinone biosynthesis C-methylase UbiE
MGDDNQKAYALASLVQHYAQLNQLQPAEARVLESLRDRIASQPHCPPFKMLDIGVGGGRTTLHFAPMVGEYVGIDYSAEMVAACQRRFPALSFAVGDARDLKAFEDDTFDFILFSFNGIDYASASDRLQILQAVHRVGKPGSLFCFSSHNLQGLERSFGVRSQLSCNPITTYANLVMLALLRLINHPINLQQIQDSAYLVVKDESHNFRLETYYIRPKEQLEQLKPSFQDIKVYSWQNGSDLTDEPDLESNVDQWLYYLCTCKEGSRSS